MPKLQKSIKKMVKKVEKEDSKEKEKDLALKKKKESKKLLEHYRSDYLELNSYHQLKKNPWAYYYVYPEYFEKAPLPGPQPQNCHMFTERKTIHVPSGNAGTVFVHFCPGATDTFLVKAPNVVEPVFAPVALPPLPEAADSQEESNRKIKTFLIAKALRKTRKEQYFVQLDDYNSRSHIVTKGAWLLTASSIAEVKAIDNDFFRGYQNEDEFESVKCVGGFVRIEVGQQNTGKVKYSELIRKSEDPDRSKLTKFLDEGVSIKSDLIFRFRTLSYDDFFHNGPDKELLAYNILLYSLTPGSVVTVTTERTFQGEVKRSPASVLGIKNGTQNDFAKARHVVKHLIKMMPPQLKISELDNPIHYHDNLFEYSPVKQTLFPVKTIMKVEPAPVTLSNIKNLDLNILADKANIQEMHNAVDKKQNLDDSAESSIIIEEEEDVEKKIENDQIQYMKREALKSMLSQKKGYLIKAPEDRHSTFN